MTNLTGKLETTVILNNSIKLERKKVLLEFTELLLSET